MRVTDSQCISLAFTDSQCISLTFMSGHFGYNNHILCGETIFVVLRRLLMNGFNAHGLDMKNRRKSVSTSYYR